MTPYAIAAIPFPGELIDYFAGQALAGFLASTAEFRHEGKVIERTETMMASLAYAQAEAMIAERERRMKK